VTRPWQRGLYAIIDAALFAGADLATQVGAAIAGGAVLVQYRDKGADAAQRHAQARALLACCRAHNIPLLINDDVDLAAAVGADGVHLGRDDTALAAARQRLGPGAIIGVSCYNLLPRAMAAAAAGADYVAFGRFFPSRTKPQAVQAELELLRRAKQHLTIPLAAIGGITADNGAVLIAAGADLLAVIHGVFAQPDVMMAASRISGLFEQQAASPKRRAFSASLSGVRHDPVT
jgi:thiamine-phosphate pyrophosphorylase